MGLTLRGKRNKKETASRKRLPVVYSDPQEGLTSAQAAERAAGGWANEAVESASKTVGQIISSNIFTWFNILFIILAVCVILVKSWYNLTFMGVVICNTFIGIVQELRSKKTLDRLSILNAQHAVVIRDGKAHRTDVHKTVRDDIVEFAMGSQIYADAVVVSGNCSVNEALVTGEADEIKKAEGDELLSGSFVVSGTCRARLTKVGRDSFVSRLTIAAKRSGKVKQSEMMHSLSLLVKWIGFILIPFGIIIFIKEVSWLGNELADSVVSTVGALVGMIPEGLYLLTSLALTAGILRLAQKKTVVHEMRCIETLARVDTLCVDKTGTITENKMIVEDVVLLCEDRFIKDDIRLIMADYVYAQKDDNDTMAALRRYFTGNAQQTAIASLPFTSARKYGGVSFHEDETYILGAPDVVLGERYDQYRDEVEKYSAQGCRVLLLALYDGTLEDEHLNAEMMPLALILLANKIRAEAPATFRFFNEQGVEIKVISGDNPMTVSEVAKRAEISGAEKWVDARELDTDAKIRQAARDYVVFGRVTPEQKRKLIRALKAAGRTVAMTGDGLNDVLALKEADCSIAMASGSEVACQVSNIVLMNSDFASMPAVVNEGRRVINNIERSASLYLIKNIYSFLLALITLFFTLPYPVTPSQLSLVNIFTIGIPSFILAMEPNNSLVKGRFLPSVIYRALPAALTDLAMVLGVLLFYVAFSVPSDEMSTICALTMGVVGLLAVDRICRPYTKLRRALIIAMTIGFFGAALILPGFFTLAELDSSSILVFVVFALLAAPTLVALAKAAERVRRWVEGKRAGKKKRYE